MKISHKLILAFSLILVGFSLLLVLFDTLLFDRYYLYKTETQLTEEYTDINAFFHSDEFDPDSINYLIKIEEESFKSNTSITFFDSTGKRKTIGPSDQPRGFRTFTSLYELGLTDKDDNRITNFEESISENGTKINFDEPEENETKNIGLIGRIVIDGETFGYVFLYTSYTVIKENTRIFNSFVFYISLIILIIAGAVSTFVSLKLTTPIKKIEEKTKKISNLDFSGGLIEYEGNDEIGDLANSINKMSQELEKSINELKEANSKLEEDIKLKERVTKLKEEFISDVSHELKTPISIINGYGEALKLDDISKDDINDYADIVIDESNRMNKLVKDLLKFTQIESGFINLDNEEINIQDLINDAIKPQELRISEKKIDLTVDVLDRVIIGDYDMLETVFNNLFTNAINHVDNNIRKIKVSSEVKNDKIRIYVYNSGDTISEENQKRIFDSFYKIDKSRSRKYGGSGLGLSIVKSIMDTYKNEFGVRNEEDGVSFYFDLTLKEAGV